MRTIPETAKREDWARLVKQAVDNLDKRVRPLEVNALSRAAMAFLS
jgi:hypothetical protein